MKYRIVHLLTAFSLAMMMLLLFFAWVRPVAAADLVVGVTPGCGTIQACINTAVPGDNIIIPANTYVESLTLNKAVSLLGADRNSTIIQAVSGQRVLTITGVTIDSSVVISGLNLQNGDVSSGNVCSTSIITKTNCGGGILVTGNAGPTLNNLIISDNSARNGGGLFVDAGSFLPPLDNVSFYSNTSTLSGGGAYFAEAVVIHNSHFQANASTANVAGGARLGGDTSINNTVFENNTATCASVFGICHAGGVYAFEANLTVNNSRFENNRCQDPFDSECDGGGIYWLRSFNGPYTVTVTNTDFINNEAGRSGAGLMIASNFFVDKIRVTGGRFEGNVAVTGDGGAIRAARLVLSGTQILTNTTGGRAGAFSEGGAVNTAYTTTITNALFSGNVSEDRGGALVVTFSGPTTIDNSTFYSNTARDNGGAIYVQTVEDLTIRNSVIEANRVLTTTTTFDYGYGGGIRAASNLFLVNTDVISNVARWRGGGIYVVPPSGGQVSVVDGRFEGNTTLARQFFNDGGGGLYVVNGSGSTTISGTTFISNTAVGVGGGGYGLGPVSLMGGLLAANESLETSGGGLFVDGVFTANNGSQFVNNRAEFSGGGLLVDGVATIADAIFTNNEAIGNSGGGAYVADQLTLTDSQFINNQTSGFAGGGLYVAGPTTVTNGLFQENVSAGQGGGAYIFSGFDSNTVNNSQFLSNTAATNGGGLTTFGNVFMTNNLFQQNQATTGSGGGLYTSSSVVVTNTTFSENAAALHGGGAYVNSNCTLIGGAFSNNQSLSGSGGGLYNFSTLTATDTQFMNNVAGLDGGGLHNDFRATMTHLTVQNNSAQRNGGGVSIDRIATVSATMILSNTAVLGGGIAISGTTSGATPSYLVNSVLARNQAASDGDGLYHNRNRMLNVIHTTIANPTQSANQAVYVITGTVQLTNTIITSHTVGVQNVGGIVDASYMLFFGNTFNRVGTVTGSNNVFGDPNFVDVNSDDFRLVIGSPALDSGIDAGITIDILGVTRPLDAGFDRGAYEGQFTPTAVGLTSFAAQTAPPLWLWLFIGLLLTLTPLVGYGMLATFAGTLRKPTQ